MGQLKWVWSQTTKMTQIKDNKSSPIKQQEDWYERGTYISKQVKMHAYHLNFETFKNAFCKFHKRNPWWDPSRKATLKWPNWKWFGKISHFREIRDLGKPPVRIRSPEKSVYFSIWKVTHHNETLQVLTWAGHPWELGHPKNLCIFSPG